MPSLSLHFTLLGALSANNIYGAMYLVIRVKLCTDVASHLLAIDLRLDVRTACDGLQQKFQHGEYFTCDPLISQSILIRFSHSFHH